ncbi:glycosyltransferase [Methylocella sp.]|uniref:glycosyltransferase n=1 Tax=Methylocella sp. TaxID=1978226 RepID=UPI003784D677
MSKRAVVFVWENFGPVHTDRCDALAVRLGRSRRVVGVELGGASSVYDWRPEDGIHFEKRTLFTDAQITEVPLRRKIRELVRACFALRPADFFFCHYETPYVFLTALLLRLAGSRVFVMNDSKFDDYKRYVGREIVKKLFYLPYSGAIAAGTRSADYFRFLGMSEKRIALNYDAISTDRIRRLAGVDRAPGGPAFAERDFIIVARMVPKKNIAMALEAYALYRAGAARPRKLRLCGSGPLEAELKAHAERLQIADDVIFHGFLQIEEVCPLLGSSLALILPSLQEQFGNVVIEAQALGLPTIVSENCGARDLLVRNGVNGFVVEPDNPRGLAFFMSLLDRDETLWRNMALATAPYSALGDAARFAESALALIGEDADERRVPAGGSASPSIADRL